MTTYTADDFAKARFAEVPGKHFAARVDRHADVLQWRASDGDWYSDEQLAAYCWVPVPAGSYTRTDEEDWKARAVKAEQERDEARTNATYWENTSAALTGAVKRWQRRAEQSRPLADEMVRRGHAALVAQTGRPQSVAAVEAVLTAALTKPTRPEGAEELARLIATADVGEWDCGDLADALLATGRVRVTGAES